VSESKPARILRLHLCEHDRYRGKPLYEAIVEKCRELHIAGATVFRAFEGYGEGAEVHRHHLLRHDLPIVISIIDSAESIARLLPVVEEMMDNGMIAMSEADVIRIQRSRRRSAAS
jgi:PII-like signaling protein